MKYNRNCPHGILFLTVFCAFFTVISATIAKEDGDKVGTVNYIRLQTRHYVTHPNNGNSLPPSYTGWGYETPKDKEARLKNYRKLMGNKTNENLNVKKVTKNQNHNGKSVSSALARGSQKAREEKQKFANFINKLKEKECVLIIQKKEKTNRENVLSAKRAIKNMFRNLILRKDKLHVFCALGYGKEKSSKGKPLENVKQNQLKK